MIDRWQQEQVLLNIKDPHYHDKVRRSNAVEQILMAMEKNKIPPPNDRRKRTERENLHCYCNTQHDSVKSSRNQTGQGADVVYKPQWQFYDS